MSGRQDQPISSISSTWYRTFFFHQCLCHPRTPTRTDLVFYAKISISNSALFPIPIPTELSQIVLPILIQQVSHHNDVVQEEPHDLRCSTKILATCDAEDVSIHMDILTLEFWAILELLSFSLGYILLILRRLLVLRNLVVLQWNPSFLRPCDADEPCSVNTA